MVRVMRGFSATVETEKVHSSITKNGRL